MLPVSKLLYLLSFSLGQHSFGFRSVSPCLTCLVYPFKSAIYTQDRRWHLKAPKFGQCCSQISGFYSSFSQLSVRRHRDYRGLHLADWIDLLFNEIEFLLYSQQQTATVNYSFVHQKKKASDCYVYFAKFSKDVLKWNFWNCYLCKISLRIRWYFSVIDIELLLGETHINLDKKVDQHWFFAISWIECILNYPIYDNFNISPTHCENFRQITQIDYL